ncbi:MAG: hypothetical protein KDE58_19890, partial [Caldilineaceae bacterium]|nr:hypothetical protein [Caldilineaceae bacterium]
RVEGGTIVANQRAGTPVGTIISVEHLFYNVPARKKFLRKASTEAGQISAVVQRYALAYPDRRFSFVNDGRLVFQSTGSGDLYDVLVKVYGLENARLMSPVGNVALGFQLANQDDPTAPTGLEQDDALALDVDFMMVEQEPVAQPASGSQAPSPILVFGYASVPTLTRANRNNINIFINRRYVEDRSLTHAIVQAYHTLLPGGRYPLATIFVTIDPRQVDVNVHPQKVQVRFVDERAVFSAVQRMVRRAMLETSPIPDMNLPQSNERGQHGSNPGGSSWSGSEWDSRGWAARRQQILNAGQRPLDLPTRPATPQAEAEGVDVDLPSAPATTAFAQPTQERRVANPADDGSTAEPATPEPEER